MLVALKRLDALSPVAAPWRTVAHGARRVFLALPHPLLKTLRRIARRPSPSAP